MSHSALLTTSARCVASPLILCSFSWSVSAEEMEREGGRGWAYEGMATASASLLMKALALVSTKERNSSGAGMLGDLGTVGEKTTIIISKKDQS